MYAVFFALLTLTVIRKRRRRGRARKQTLSPLAGMDTGTRSAFRVPRGVRFHKGF